MEASPNAVFICVTNPLDVMTTLAFRESGLPANRLMGMGGVLDSSRLAFAVCEQLGCAPADVTAWAVGAHGEGMVCWPRFTTVDGTPITELMDEAAVASVVQRCVKGGAEVVAFLSTGRDRRSPYGSNRCACGKFCAAPSPVSQIGYSGRFANPARTLSALARSAASSSSFRSNSTTSSTPFLPRRTGTFM